LPSDRTSKGNYEAGRNLGRGTVRPTRQLPSVRGLDAEKAKADPNPKHAANLVKTPDDIEAALERIAAIDGVDGVLIVWGDRIGLAGDLPPVVRNRDAELGEKVTRDPASGR